MENIRYVKVGGSGTKTGLSWANASDDIQKMIEALAIIDGGGQVWIAGGTYLLSATLHVKPGVNIYGSFIGTESAANDNAMQNSISTRPKNNANSRPWDFANLTVLDGQEKQSVLCQDFSEAEIVIDGLCVTRGKGISYGGVKMEKNGLIRNCSVTGNSALILTGDFYDNAGGIHNSGGKVSYCNVIENTSPAAGGGIYNGPGGTVNNCEVIGNKATVSGGGICNDQNGEVIACTIIGNQAGDSGGGIYNSGSVSNCVINTNTAAYTGGGIANNSGSITNCSLNENKAGTSGGGIYNSLGFVIDCGFNENTILSKNDACGGGIYNTGTMINCFVSGNAISGNTYIQGGGIYNDSGTATKCVIIGNSALSADSATDNMLPMVSGGGIYNTGKGKIIGCCIERNRASSTFPVAYGGGINNDSGIVTNCFINGNIASVTAMATSPSLYGGGVAGMYASWSHPDDTNLPESYISDCFISNNDTLINGISGGSGGGIANAYIFRCVIEGNNSFYGGGLSGCHADNCLVRKNNATYNGGGGTGPDSTYINCTFVSNSASHGGAIDMGKAVNCIFWNNRASTRTGYQVFGASVTYSAIQNGYTGTGNINLLRSNSNPRIIRFPLERPIRKRLIQGPLFVDPSTGNYQLQPDSPCINKGINSVVTTGMQMDLAGYSRIINNIVDMGTYECQNPNEKMCLFPPKRLYSIGLKGLLTINN
jgi:hypothetical protein